jgi:hypothetical protein
VYFRVIIRKLGVLVLIFVVHENRMMRKKRFRSRTKKKKEKVEIHFSISVFCERFVPFSTTT